MHKKSDDSGSEQRHVRRFEVGPMPGRWPRFTEYDAVPEVMPPKYLRTALKNNRSLFIVSAVISFCGFLDVALLPWVLNILLDSGIKDGITAALVPGILAFIAYICTSVVGSWADAVLTVPDMRVWLGSTHAIVNKIAGVRGGGKQKIPSGEIVAAATSDTIKLGRFATQLCITTGGAFSAGVVVVLMLRISLSLGLIVTIGLPIIVGMMAALAKPLQKKMSAAREEKGKLTTFAADAVTGLRVMRGVGGEVQYNHRYAEQSKNLRDAGIKMASVASFMDGLTTAVPSIFTAVIVGAGIWEYYEGALTLGQLVAFYGYTGYLSAPIWQAQAFFFSRANSRVAEERIERVLAIEPLTSAPAPVREHATVETGAAIPAQAHKDTALVSAEGSLAYDGPELDWNRVSLRDGFSEVLLEAGKITAFVANNPDVSAALADRLGRTDDAYDVYVEICDDDTTKPLGGIHSDACSVDGSFAVLSLDSPEAARSIEPIQSVGEMRSEAIDAEKPEHTKGAPRLVEVANQSISPTESTESLEHEYPCNLAGRSLMVQRRLSQVRFTLANLPLDRVRHNVVLSGALPELFQGTLLSNVQGRWDSSPSARSIADQMGDTGDGTGIAHRKYIPQVDAPSMEDIDVAMRSADAIDIVAIGEGYSEHVAEKGRTLSGGQRQRISLARALLTKAPILLLIEPTSAVDSHTESRIARALGNVREGKTTGVVTTSPIVLGVADVVVLLDDDGREIARGSHRELLHHPRYYAIVHRAAGESESVGSNSRTVSKKLNSTSNKESTRRNTCVADIETSSNAENNSDGETTSITESEMKQ